MLVLADEQFVAGLLADTYWALGDNQNTVRDVANYNAVLDETTIAKHRAFASFGEITDDDNPSLPFLYAYTGREWGADAELYYYRKRWYDAKAGKFVSEDPIGFAAGDTNLGRYVRNSSMNRTDPTGLHFSDPPNASSPPAWQVTLFNAWLKDHPIEPSWWGHNNHHELVNQRWNEFQAELQRMYYEHARRARAMSNAELAGRMCAISRQAKAHEDLLASTGRLDDVTLKGLNYLSLEDQALRQERRQIVFDESSRLWWQFLYAQAGRSGDIAGLKGQASIFHSELAHEHGSITVDVDSIEGICLPPSAAN